MEDVVKTVKAFIGYLDGPSGYMISLFQVINDIPEYGFFTFVAGIHLHSCRYLVCIKEQAQSDDWLFFVFL